MIHTRQLGAVVRILANLTEYLSRDGFTPNLSSLSSHIRPEIVKKKARTTGDSSGRVVSAGALNGALTWELVRLFDSFTGRKSESVLSYLATAEEREPDPWRQDDIRIAWLTVLHAAAGVADAWGFSFWQFFGKTYPKALLLWAERDEINRKALERCAAEVLHRQQIVEKNFPLYVTAREIVEGQSKKPATSVKPERKERAA